MGKKGKSSLAWLLVYTKVKGEKRAQRNIENQGFETFLPLIAPSNKKKDLNQLVPVFPRYLFVQVNLEKDNWTSIRSSLGVSKIVMFSEKFPFIPAVVIKTLKKKLDKRNIFKEEILKSDFKKGDKLKVKDGIFNGLDAIFVAEKSKHRVTLLLNFLNTMVVTDISKSDLGNKETTKVFKF